ncbi:MAG: helix-turn-helix domain-containing protein [Smithella sp.]
MSKLDESLDEQVKALQGDLTARRLLKSVRGLTVERREKLMETLGSETFTPEETAKILRKHHSTVRRWLRNGTLQATKLQRSWIVPRSEIERILGRPFPGQAALRQEDKETTLADFRQVCTDRGEDPDEILKNLMAEYVNAVREDKTQEAGEGPAEGRQKLPKRKAKVEI